MTPLVQASSQVWVTPRAIAALIWHIAQDTSGIIGLAEAGQAGQELSKAHASQAVKTQPTAEGLSVEVFVIMQRGSNLDDLARSFAERVQQELSKALEQPIHEVLIRIQSVR